MFKTHWDLLVLIKVKRFNNKIKLCFCHEIYVSPNLFALNRIRNQIDNFKLQLKGE